MCTHEFVRVLSVPVAYTAVLQVRTRKRLFLLEPFAFPPDFRSAEPSFNHTSRTSPPAR